MDLVLLTVIAGAAAAGFAQGLSGFAFAMISMSFWAWVLEPQTAAVLCVVCSLIGQVLTLPSVKAGFSFQRIWPFVAGGVVGVPLGAWILPLVDQSVFRVILGTFLTLWASAMLFSGGQWKLKIQNTGLDGGVGVIGGVLGGLGGLAGAIPTLWCSLKAWDKAQQRAVIQLFNLSMHIFTLAAYVLGGLITAEASRWLLVALPAMLIPSFIGNRLYTKISDQAFRRLVLVLLLTSGVVLLAATLPRLI
jgi:uncharacterized membrane protein YfcA